MTQTNLERLPEATGGKQSKLPLVVITAFVLSLLPPLAILVGYFFLEGYLSAFGLNMGFFPRSFQEYALNSSVVILYIVAWFQQVIHIQNLGLWAALGVVLLVFMKFLDVLDSYLNRLSSRIEPVVHGRHISGLGKQLAQLALFIGFPGLCFIVLFTLVLPSLAAHFIGKGAAQDTIEEFWGCTPRVYKCAKLYDNGTLIAEGLIIEASDKFVAIYDNSTARLLPLTPTSVLEVLLVKPQEGIKDDL